MLSDRCIEELRGDYRRVYNTGDMEKFKEVVKKSGRYISIYGASGEQLDLLCRMSMLAKRRCRKGVI